MPMAGATSPMAENTLAPQRCRSSVSRRSFSSLERTTSGAWPSTIIWMPILKNVTSVSWPSSAKKPSLRAMRETSRISSIRASVAGSLNLKALTATLKAPKTAAG